MEDRDKNLQLLQTGKYIYIYIYIYRHTVLGSSVATSGDAISLTTFLSSVVVASLFSESNSSSVAKLYF